MFSGIVEEKAKVETLSAGKLTVRSLIDHTQTKIGDSIAINGACLTVTNLQQIGNGYLISFDVSNETLRRTAALGKVVNLERALVFGDRVHGHLVAGHVDCTTKLLSKKAEGESFRLEWELPRTVKPFIAEKGSVALSGVSLTVGEVLEASFATYIIPHTLGQTTLSDVVVGAEVNLEVDLMARYVRNIMDASKKREIDEEFLRENGFIK